MFLFLKIFFISNLFSILAAQNCRNDEGESVDWFFAYKPPAQKSQKNLYLREGIGYIYITSMHSSNNWKMSTKSINESGSFFGQTLSPIYESSAKDLFYILYNDSPPSGPDNFNFGHAKGVVMADGKTGLWMIHSSPKFPIEPITATKNKNTTNKFFFPSSATKFGQSFLCLSLPVSEMNKIGINLQYIRPNVYSYNVPKILELKFYNLTEVVRKKYIRKFPWSHKTQLKTLNGKTFISYAKAKNFHKDLYTDFLAPDVESDLLVESWSNGKDELPSDCTNKYHVMDVASIKIKTDDNYIEFKNSQDHSKWAVSANNKYRVICIGDINRMLPQFKRGGGAVCYKNSFVWSKYINAVSNVYPCSSFAGKKAAISFTHCTFYFLFLCILSLAKKFNLIYNKLW